MRRIVLDTNCLIAALPSRSAFHVIWEDFVQGKYILCVSNEILTEYEEIIAQKTNPVFANNVIKTILNLRNVEKIDPRYDFRLIEADLDDNKFVNCAICGNANYIISEDSHFRILKQISFPSITLLNIKEFVVLLKQVFDNPVHDS